MRSVLVLLLALLALACVAFWWLGTGDERIASVPTTGEQRASEATIAKGTNAAERGPANATARERTAVEEAPARPHPADAQWIDVLVVDEANEPVANADIYWHHSESEALLYADKRLPPMLRSILEHEPESVSLRCGWQTKSDERGLARITQLGQTEVSGVHDGLFGTFALDPLAMTPNGGHRLVLLHDSALRVHVVAIDGRPCEGVPVTFMQVDEDGDMAGEFGWQPLAITDAEGNATIRHMQRHVRAIDTDEDTSSLQLQAYVRPFLPGIEEPGIAFDLHDLPRRRITLRLPPFGTVKSRAEMHGKQVSREHGIVLTGNGEELYPGHLIGHPGDDDWAWFHHVPLHHQMRAHSLATRDVNVLFDSPAAQDQTIEVVIVPSRDRIVMTGRAVTAAGKPIANEHLNLQMYDIENLPRWRQATTDDDGNFVISFGREEQGRTYRYGSASLYPIDRDWSIGRASLPAHTFHAGTHELGDVVMQAGELFVKGRLRVDGKPFDEDCQLKILRFHPERKPGEQWRSFAEASVQIEDDGRFVAYGVKQPGRYSLNVYSQMCAETEPVEFELGTEDLIVDLEAAFTLSAGLLAPADTDLEQIICQLRRQDGKQFDEWTTDRFEQRPKHRQNERSDVIWPGLPPGAYTLDIRSWSHPRALIEIADIELPPPAGGDARLADIDLRELVQTITVHLYEEDGSPIEDSGALFTPGQTQGNRPEGFPVNGKTTRCVLPAGPVHLIARIEEHQPATLRGSGPELTARLYRWPVVELLLKDVPELPDGADLQVRIEPQQATDRSWHGPWWQEDLQPLMGITWRNYMVTDETIVADVADGPHKLTIHLGSDDERFTVTGTTPAVIYSSTPKLTVSAPKARWQRAIEQYLQSRR